MTAEWYCPDRGEFRGPDDGRQALFQHRADQLGEAVPGPIQAALHGSQVALRDLGDFLIALSLELTEDEHLPVMLGELVHAGDLNDGKFERPEAAGLSMTLHGLSAVYDDDHELLKAGMAVFDGLYAVLSEKKKR